MTWSSLASVVTPAPTSTTTPAPSWPRMAGNRPSGSSPDKVNQSVWQMPVALTSTSTSPARGPSRSTVSIVRGSPAFQATAARVFIASSPVCLARAVLEHFVVAHDRAARAELALARDAAALVVAALLAQDAVAVPAAMHAGRRRAAARAGR